MNMRTTDEGASQDTHHLTDDEVMNSSYVAPVVTSEEVTESVTETVSETVETLPVVEEVLEPVVVDGVTEPVIEPVKEDTPEPVLNDLDFEKIKNPLDLKTPKEVIKEPENKETVKPVTEPVIEAKPVDYAEFYKKIMTPFKANGKMIELKDPEEAVQLMQMGANYTRKMQDLQAVKKQLTMLENNGLLDEGKLSFLIDLDKKNPEAIKKFLKEAEIDPLDIDTSAEITYQAGNHIVSDDEVKFRTVLDAVSATPEGKATLQVINTSWDQASKDALWASPDIMEVISEQRTNGIYDRVTAEVERQIVLGGIKPGTPFLTAYQAIGQTLGKQGVFDDILQKQNSVPVVKPQPVAIATKVVTPKPTVVNNPQVAAAAVTRSSGKKAVTTANLAGLTDDQFMSHFAGRV